MRTMSEFDNTKYKGPRTERKAEALGPSFADEIIADGLQDLPIVWQPDGTIIGYGDLSRADQARVDKVISKHNPKAKPKAGFHPKA
jgi:hypothetical protein